MEAILERCAGLDVHQKTVTACVLLLQGKGPVTKSVRTFGTMTVDLLALADWLSEQEVSHVAMESTGVLWKPVFNILESQFTLLLVNAQHIKNVPGRKTDVKDSEWIAQLLQHGLLSASFVPERPVRELRDLTRNRAQLNSEKTRQINRIHKVLEDANIKLGAVASDIMGVSGRAMQALIEGGQTPQAMAQLARKKLRQKIPELEQALQGRISEHHQFLLRMHYEHVLYVEEQLAKLSARIVRLIDQSMPPRGPDSGATTQDNMPAPLSLGEAVQLVDTVPGIDVSSAQDLLVEIGTDMGRFPTHKHLSSWACQCPGNYESAGKKGKGKRRKGNRWLSRVLSEIAWAATHTKDTYLAALYKRLARKRGKKRAIVAVGHAILVIVYHMLRHHCSYHELGVDFLDRLEPIRVGQYHLQRLRSLGYVIQIVEQPVAA